MPGSAAAPTGRKRSLVLAMPMEGTVPRSDLAGLTPKRARLYAGAGPRTLSRDVNHLIEMGLSRRRGGRGYEVCTDVVLAFLSPIADSTDEMAGRQTEDESGHQTRITSTPGMAS